MNKPGRADPARIGEALRELVAHRGWHERLALGRLKADWRRVVGDHVAARSEPVRLSEGRLTIRVEPGAWAAELALMGRSLGEAVARYLGEETPREVNVVAGSLSRPRD